jgi:hypothetical protein
MGRITDRTANSCQAPAQVSASKQQFNLNQIILSSEL